MGSGKEANMNRARDLGWWYWACTVVFLVIGLAGHRAGIWWAIGLCIVQVGHVAWLTQDPTAFPVQVRLAYLALLLAGLWSPLQWIHWVQLTGTTARVTLGYCFLARSLSLAPWNRHELISLGLLRRTYLSLQTAIPPCGAVFRRISFERAQL
jgi:hypothetical protein